MADNRKDKWAQNNVFLIFEHWNEARKILSSLISS